MTDRRRWFALAAIGLVAAMSAVAQPWNAGLSSYVAVSDPRHECLPWKAFWVKAPDPTKRLSVGDIVVVDPALSGVRALSEVESNIIKMVLAGPGDHVLWTSQGLFVNGDRYAELAHPTLLEREQAQVLPAGRYVFVGVTEQSFDGRYFGSIDQSAVVGSATPLFVRNWDSDYLDRYEESTSAALDFILSRRDRQLDGSDRGGRVRAVGTPSS